MKWLPTLAITAGAFLTAVDAACQDTIGQPCGDSSKPREENCCSSGFCMPWNSNYYQCIDTPSMCPAQETDIDYEGHDIKTVYGVLPPQCCEACYNTAGCVGYTIVNENPDGRSACYLKSSVDGSTEKKGAVSAKLEMTPAPEKCSKQERGIDYYGYDMNTVENVDQGACCDACSTTEGCVGYSFVQDKADGKGMCYLKWSMAGRVEASGVVSGAVDETKPPAKCPTQEVGYDYYGNDISTVSGVSIGECCEACAATSGCGAYSFKVQDWDGRSSCFLKTTAGGRTPMEGVVSGELTCPTELMGQCGSSASGPLCCPEGAYCQAWNPWYYQCIAKPEDAKCPTMVPDMDFKGGDLEVKYGLLPAECCDACYNHDECRVFTFVNYNPDGRSACYLKGSLTEQVVTPGAVSGYKNKMANMPKPTGALRFL